MIKLSQGRQRHLAVIYLFISSFGGYLQAVAAAIGRAELDASLVDIK